MAESSKRPAAETSPPVSGPTILKMMWSNLLFLHWPIPAELLRPHVPRQLELDLFEGNAWVGVIPFRMSGVRPLLTPAVPGLSSFLEINVRTYVRYGGIAGVFFFSLDASSAIAVWMARTFFHLPYFRATMQMTRREDGMHFASRRTHQGAQPAEFECVWTAGKPLPPAKPGELAFFVTERYQLFTVHRKQVFGCCIEHEKWPLREARLDRLQSSLVEAAGLPSLPGQPVAYHCDALAVEICPLRESGATEEAASLLGPAPAS